MRRTRPIGCLAILLLTLFGCRVTPDAKENAADAKTNGPVTAEERTAIAYLDAITRRDWEDMAAFLGEGSVYRDVTMAHFDSPAIDLRGVEPIVEFWRKSYEDTDARVENRILTRFTAGSWVILVLRPDISIDGAYWDVPGERIEGRFDQITILRIEGGKVRHHTDHVDYAEAMQHVEAARTAARGQETRG